MNNAKVNCGECKYYKGIVIPTGANPEIRVSAVEGPAVHSTSTQLNRKPCCSCESMSFQDSSDCACSRACRSVSTMSPVG